MDAERRCDCRAGDTPAHPCRVHLWPYCFTHDQDLRQWPHGNCEDCINDLPPVAKEEA